MIIKRFVLGLLQSNGYVIRQKNGTDCYLIDPGAKAKIFLQYIEEENLTVKGILLTHHHHDHVGAVGAIVKATSCPVFIHRLDMDYLKMAASPLEDGDLIDLEGETIQVIHTPGHTKGGVCFYSQKSKLAFTGDTIFNVDLGRTDLADGSQEQMEASIKNIIDRWGNDITIHPGHGDPCTMKAVRQQNLEYLAITQPAES